MQKPDSRDHFSSLRLIAYLEEGVGEEADEFVGRNAGLYYTDDQWQEFGDEKPWYEWPRADPEWPHTPGTVFADFSCPVEGGEFAFNGFWQIRQGPNILLEGTRLTLLTKLPHFAGYSLSRHEQATLASMIRRVVAQLNNEPDDFGSYIDESLLEFWEREHTAR